MFCSSTNNSIFDIARLRIENGLINGLNVVFDATNINENSRKSIIDIGLRNNAQIIGIIFKTPLNICIQRNFQRPHEKRVPDDKIILMSNFNSNIDQFKEGFNKLIYVP